MYNRTTVGKSLQKFRNTVESYVVFVLYHTSSWTRPGSVRSHMEELFRWRQRVELLGIGHFLITLVTETDARLAYLMDRNTQTNRDQSCLSTLSPQAQKCGKVGLFVCSILKWMRERKQFFLLIPMLGFVFYSWKASFSFPGSSLVLDCCWFVVPSHNLASFCAFTDKQTFLLLW